MGHTDTQMNPQAEDTQRRFENVGVADLRHLKTREDFEGLRLQNVGVVLVGEEQMQYLGLADVSNVGTTVAVPSEGKVRVMTGQLTIDGTVLAQPQDPDAVLVIAGQATIMPPVTSIGYQKLIIAGQLIVPRALSAEILSKAESVAGQLLFYSGDQVRVFVGQRQISAGFLELVEQPLTLVLVGDFKFTKDVTPELLKAKVREIVLVGKLKAPRPLLPVVEYLAVEQTGDIQPLHEDGDEGGA